VDIDSGKTGPPKPLGGEAEPEGASPALDLPRDEVRRRSLVGGVVKINGEDCDIAGATVFADGTTETDTIDDNLGVLVTQQTSGGNSLTITDDDKGELQSIIKGDVNVEGDLNVDIDNGSRVEGRVRANAGTVSLNDVTITGPNPDPDAIDDDALIIGDGGEIDQLNGDATIQGNVRVKSGGTLAVSGSATIEGDLIVEAEGTANKGSVDVEGDVIRR
jgi:cytoskeletal protein CcmA (bactofilin family)